MMIPRRLDTVYPILSFFSHRLCYFPQEKKSGNFLPKSVLFLDFLRKSVFFLDFLPKSVFFLDFLPKSVLFFHFLPKSVLSSKLLHWVQIRRRYAGVSLNYQGLVRRRYSVIKFKKVAGFTPMALRNSSEEILPCCHWSYSGAHFPVKS